MKFMIKTQKNMISGKLDISNGIELVTKSLFLHFKVNRYCYSNAVIALSNLFQKLIGQIKSFAKMFFKMICGFFGLLFTSTCMTLKVYSVLLTGATILCLTELSCSVFIAMLLCSTNLNRKQPKVIFTVKVW